MVPPVRRKHSITPPDRPGSAHRSKPPQAVTSPEREVSPDQTGLSRAPRLPDSVSLGMVPRQRGKGVSRGSSTTRAEGPGDLESRHPVDEPEIDLFPLMDWLKHASPGPGPMAEDPVPALEDPLAMEMVVDESSATHPLTAEELETALEALAEDGQRELAVGRLATVLGVRSGDVENAILSRAKGQTPLEGMKDDKGHLSDIGNQTVLDITSAYPHIGKQVIGDLVGLSRRGVDYYQSRARPAPPPAVFVSPQGTLSDEGKAVIWSMHQWRDPPASPEVIARRTGLDRILVKNELEQGEPLSTVAPKAWAHLTRQEPAPRASGETRHNPLLPPPEGVEPGEWQAVLAALEHSGQRTEIQLTGLRKGNSSQASDKGRNLIVRLHQMNTPLLAIAGVLGFSVDTVRRISLKAQASPVPTGWKTPKGHHLTSEGWRGVLELGQRHSQNEVVAKAEISRKVAQSVFEDGDIPPGMTTPDNRHLSRDGIQKIFERHEKKRPVPHIAAGLGLDLQQVNDALEGRIGPPSPESAERPQQPGSGQEEAP